MADLAGGLLEDFIPVVKFQGIRSNKNMEFGTSATVTLPADTTIGGSAVVALGDITSSSTSATAFTVTNTGIFTGASVVSFVANSLTTGTQFLITANGVTSGHMLSLVSTGTIVTTGDVLSIAANTATTSTGLLRISGTGLTDGFPVAITSGGANLTANGGGINLSLGANTLGTGISVVSTGAMITTSSLVTLTANSATTAAGLLRINGNALTSGIGAVITSSSAVVTGAGRLLRVDHTGAATNAGGGILSEFASAAADGTTILRVTASAALAAGVVLDLSAAALTTGKVIDISNLDAITTGKAIHVDATGVTQTDAILVHIDSASTALTSTGRLLLVDHTGNAGVSTVIAEVKSAAADETVVFQVLASGLLAAGKVVNVSAASMTTGTALSIADANALTTGMIAQFKSNSSDATARTLVDIHNDHASAAGVVPLKITNDAPTSTNFKLMATFGTIQLFISDQTSPNGSLSATEGSICLNGSATGQAFWNNDGATSWVALA